MRTFGVLGLHDFDRRTTRKWLKRVSVACALLFQAGAVLASDFNLGREHVPGQLLIKFKSSAKSSDKVVLLAKLGAKSLHTYASRGAQLIEIAAKSDEKALLRTAVALSEDPRVEYVEANTILHADLAPDDTRFGELWGMRNTGANNGVVGADIKAVQAWDITTGSRDVLVGVIDTGIEYTHPDIQPNYWTNPGESGLDSQGREKATNGVDDDGNSFIDDFKGWNFVANTNDPRDDNKHGTHCAGTIGGRGNDGVGVAGVNWNVSMVAIKFLDAAGSGNLGNAVRAIEYGTALGVNLTSNSWGGGGFSQTMEDAIRAANDRGILFVAAAGNDSADNDADPHYPAAYNIPNIVAVAATDNRDQLANFSNYGARTVHLAAPGKGIVSAVLNGGWDSLSGTSMATPHVSGAVALVKARFPNLTMFQVRDRVVGTVDITAAATGKTISGGRLNVFNALEDDSVVPGLATNLAVASTGLNSFRITFTPAGDDGTQGLASRYLVRFSPNPIQTIQQWNAATVAVVEMVSSTATLVAADVIGLPFNSAGYVAVRAIDNVGNVGGVANSIAFSTRPVQMIVNDNAESTNGMTNNGWGLETLADNSHAFSDSVAGMYVENADTSLATATIYATSSDLSLAFDIRHELEGGYDFCRIEISTDGATWSELRKYTGTSEWKTETISLSVAANASFQLRFHLTSDFSVQKDGCLIDNVRVYAPAP